MKVNETFYSIQGEGKFIGTPAFFIRFSGCNLRCDFCDSKYAWKEGREISVKELAAKTGNHSHIVLTGGEPLLQEDLPDLIKKINGRIEIETNGTIFNSQIANLANITVSPKPQYMNDNYKYSLKKWANHATFKYVIKNRKDFRKAKNLSESLKINSPILMPEGIRPETIIERTKQLVKWSKREWETARIIPRLHILLYNNKRGK